MRRKFDVVRDVVRHVVRLAATIAAVMAASGARAADRPVVPPAGIPALPPAYQDWPRVESPIPRDPAVEARIAGIVAGMTLEEKIGQMTQPDAHAISPADVRRYHIGTVLSGGGGWPNQDKRAPASEWLKMSDAMWDASMSTDSKVKIPILWGIDAVHGNARPFGTTVFPHHIGLGAAHDPDLVRRIAEATARQMRLTGHDWAFAPCVAVVRDDRWGRTYESWSEDPAIVRAYAAAEVAGLQNMGATPDGKKAFGVLATAKHFLGDGGTLKGVDQGPNLAPEADLINIHGQGYYGAIGAGVQSVMPSFNSLVDPKNGITPATMAEGKIHGSKHMITEVLEGKIGFDGLVVSDWKGAGQVPGCTATRCARAINAGIDVMMVADEWRGFYNDTLDLVKKGEIPMARIDDAVTRILRVKFRMGLFDMPKPSLRPGATDASKLQAKELAVEAVQKSLVLLKNDGKVLPLKPTARVLVVGKGADSLRDQTGGWTLDWRGDQNVNADFPGGTTVLAGVKRVVGEKNVTFSERAEGVDAAGFDVVIAVIGETPYVEFTGDLMPGNPNVPQAPRTLELAALQPRDLQVLNRVSGKGKPVVTVLLSGRPLYTNRELNRSDAFVAAWLPGTEGGAIADVLFAGSDGKPRKDFTGKLSFSWPKADCQQPLNVGDAGYDPLFPYGFGLSYADAKDLGKLPEPASMRCE